MAKRVLSIRIDEDLLDAVRDEAKANDRSVSGQVVYALRQATPPRPRRGKPILGWLEHMGPSEDLSVFRKLRKDLTRAWKKRLRRFPE
jgi:hypothetical protein